MVCVDGRCRFALAVQLYLPGVTFAIEYAPFLSVVAEALVPHLTLAPEMPRPVLALRTWPPMAPAPAFTTAVAAESTDLAPYAFVAVSRTRTVRPTSAGVSV